MRVWGITRLGKKVSGNISAPRSKSTDVLRHLHSGSATDEEIADDLGISRARTSRMLRRLGKRGLVSELTRGSEETGV